ncbi:MAG: MogA/MoaB family molybdenum cofactor biosynthesis protein [Acidobacteriota bacterium]|nr:MogA/MoaB family molybdenum cofactor biosynthesis protein [Acidobacteriota bacterium]
MRAAILTISDRGARGEREDLSGPALAKWVMEHGVEVAAAHLVADEIPEIAQAICNWADGKGVDVILTTGGTGVSPRDVTPEATVQVLDRLIPGLGEAMRAASLRKTILGALSRGLCGVRRQTLILNLPGSPKAAIENLEAIWEAVPHAVAKIQGDPSDCVPLER